MGGRQVCTGVMLHGYPLVKTLCGGLQVRLPAGAIPNLTLTGHHTQHILPTDSVATKGRQHSLHTHF